MEYDDFVKSMDRESMFDDLSGLFVDGDIDETLYGRDYESDEDTNEGKK